MKKMLSRICVLILTFLVCFPFALAFSVFGETASDETTVAAQTTTASSSDTTVELTIDVNQLYTGGVNYDGNKLSQNISAKALYIGVICLLLIVGIIIIAVKARSGDDEDEKENDEKAPELPKVPDKKRKSKDSGKNDVPKDEKDGD